MTRLVIVRSLVSHLYNAIESLAASDGLLKVHAKLFLNRRQEVVPLAGKSNKSPLKDVREAEKYRKRRTERVVAVEVRT